MWECGLGHPTTCSKSTYLIRMGRCKGPMWRHYLRDGLEPPEMPLFSQFKKAVESASKKATTNQVNP